MARLSRRKKRKMYPDKIHGWGRATVAVAVLALSSACGDNAALDPELPGSELRRGSSAAPAQFEGIATRPASTRGTRTPDLGACNNLPVPGSSKIAFRVFATGVQIYTWTGTTWNFVAPEAELYADAGGHGLVGTHYGGPTWESVNGGKVYGSVLQRCTPDPAAIPWLLLAAVPDGPGIFHRVSYIHRLNTTGGNAPSRAGTVPGEVARVPYTADYVFYRAHY